MASYDQIAQDITDDSERLKKIASTRGGYQTRQGTSERTWLDQLDVFQEDFTDALPALVDEATAKAVAASEASGVVGWFDDKAALDTALATLADNVYGVVADETHDDRRYRYRVTDHAIVNSWLDDEGVRLTGNNLTTSASWDDVPEIENEAVNEVTTKLANRFGFLESVDGAQKVGFAWPTTGAGNSTVEGFLVSSGVVPFELLGGVGDGDYLTGAGTDNAAAFALAKLAGEAGYAVKFATGAQYKTTETIRVHNMRWLGDGDCTPIIFGWFAAAGGKIISWSQDDDAKSASIDGLTFWRCGPHPEHGIVIDNMSAFRFRGRVLAVQNSDGGAIGISAFYDTRRPSTNVYIDAIVEQSGDYGVQFGDVSNVTVKVDGRDCYREVIGIEPTIRDVFAVPASAVLGDTFTISDHGLKLGDPVSYSPRGNTPALPRAAYYFAIPVDGDRFKLSDSQYLARLGVSVSVGSWVGTHWIVRCAIADNINVLPSTLVDENSIKPPLFASTTGYIIATGNSGGWVGTVNLASPLVVGRRDPSDTVTSGIRLEGVQGVTVKTPKIVGCHHGVRVLNGTVTNFVNAAGTQLDDDYPITVAVDGNVLIGVDAEDFGVYGVYVQHGVSEFVGGSVRSKVTGAIGVYDISGMKPIFRGITADVPNGIAYSGFSGDSYVRGTDLEDRASGVVVSRTSPYFARSADANLRSRVSGAAIATIRSATGTALQYIGQISVTARSSNAAAANTARYVLDVAKPYSGATPTVTLVRAAGLTAGASANHPSFTFSMSGDDLIATAVASTSVVAPFYFAVESNGSISFV